METNRFLFFSRLVYRSNSSIGEGGGGGDPCHGRGRRLLGRRGINRSGKRVKREARFRGNWGNVEHVERTLDRVRGRRAIT